MELSLGPWKLATILLEISISLTLGGCTMGNMQQRLLVATTPSFEPPSLLLDTGQHTSFVPPAGAREMRRRFVTFNETSLRPPHNQRVKIQLFHGRTLEADGIRTVLAGEGYVWIGQVRNQPTSLVILSVQDHALAGNIFMGNGDSYEIGAAGDGLHYVRELERSSRIDDVNAGIVNLALAERPAGDPCDGTETGDVIEVLIAYTKTALAACYSKAAMEARIYGAVEATNISYKLSGISQRMQIAQLKEVDYTETNDSCIDLTRMQNPKDNFLDDLINDRDTASADLVFLIVDGQLQTTTQITNGVRDGCSSAPLAVNGEAFGILDPVDASWHPNGFAVVRSSMATTELAFAHESGHLMGARHEADVDGETSPYPYGHGFYDTTCNTRSVMATNACCIRNAYWSNSNHFTPCITDFGINNLADNALALSRSAKAVASFRCSSSGHTDVWMRDTWNDTGAEPNSTVEPMWESPYIWVRRTQDIYRLYQHEHQSPSLNQQVFVYVKVHNGSTSAAIGVLELYYSDASTAASFPTNWKTIGSMTFTGTVFPAKTTGIFEFPFSTPASTPLGSGRFAYLARWVSPADPINVVSTDVETITRASNNIVWRSDEIAGQGAPAYVAFVVRNGAIDPEKPNAPITLTIAPPPDEINGSVFFFAHGFVTLSDEVAAAWREGGRRGRGFTELQDGRLCVNAAEGIVLDNIRLVREGTVRVDFERKDDTPKRDYRIQASQSVAGKRRGAVTFDVKALE